MTSQNNATQHLSALPQSWRDRAFREPDAVLLDTSLPSEAERYSYLFTGATEILKAREPEDLPNLFVAVERALAAGSYVAGWFAYEAGAHFFGAEHFRADGPLAVLGVFPAPKVFDHLGPAVAETAAATPPPLRIAPMMHIDHSAYVSAVEQIQEWIAAGETYQVNFTSSMVTPCHDDAATIYESLRAQQPCGYAAVVRLEPSQTMLSFSPELFFRVDVEGTITTKPMKGTAKRGENQQEDAERIEQLRADEKNRAEHVMIVDLLRNDLGRICETGSVRVDELFSVEPYNELLQMTSTVQGALPPDTRWYDVFQSLFPCGSITGAPKRHTIKLIRQIETEPRGVYTGAIGYFAPDRTACFNVAIRTVVLAQDQLTLGVGGGIVADSVPEDEYAECLLKARFLQRASEPLALIETMRWESGGCVLLERHIRRLLASATAVGIPVEADAISESIQQASAGWSASPQRVRLTANRQGHLTIDAVEAHRWRAGLRLRLSSLRTQSGAPHLRHKTTFRPEYDTEFRATNADGYDEAIFCNERGEMTEGCISSLLVRLEGRWYTPPLSAGVLPGVYRGLLLDQGLIAERPITLLEMESAESVAMCNAVRGVGHVGSIDIGDRRILVINAHRFPA